MSAARELGRAAAFLCVAALGSLASAARQAGSGSTRPAAPGIVVVQDRAFEFDREACARILARMHEGPRLAIALPGHATVPLVDPFARAGGECRTLELDPSVEHAGERSDIGARVRAASCVTLIGGDHVAWYTVLTPGGKASELGDALHEAQRSGTIVAACGGAAGFLAQWSLVDRESLQRPPRNPRRLEPDVVLAGLGLVRDVLIETASRRQGDLSSLFDALIHDAPGLALCLDGEVAWVCDGAERTVWVEGEGVALLFDASGARRQRDAIRLGRLSLLRRGDRFEAEHRTVATLDRAFPRTTDIEASAERIAAKITAIELIQGLSRLGSPGAAVPIELVDGAHRLTLWADENSRLRPAAPGVELAMGEIAFDLRLAAE